MAIDRPIDRPTQRRSTKRAGDRPNHRAIDSQSTVLAISRPTGRRPKSPSHGLSVAHDARLPVVHCRSPEPWTPAQRRRSQQGVRPTSASLPESTDRLRTRRPIVVSFFPDRPTRSTDRSVGQSVDRFLLHGAEWPANTKVGRSMGWVEAANASSTVLDRLLDRGPFTLARFAIKTLDVGSGNRFSVDRSRSLWLVGASVDRSTPFFLV